MKIQLSDHFNYKKLFAFTIPSVAMMIFTSIYGVVDGFFVSNFAGETAFASVNFIMPFLMLCGSVGFMFGAGGSALIAKTLGEGDKDMANKQFSLIVYFSIACAIVLAILGLIFLEDIALLLGASENMLPDCLLYGRIILCSLPAFVLQFEFQSLFITAEKPQLGFFVTLASGLTNMVLDALLLGVFKFGVAGAATATAISQLVGGITPLFYFARKNTSLLSLTKTRFYGKALVKTCTNGSSEFLSNVSMSVVGMLYNAQLMKYVGEQGVSAYGVLMYVCFIFMAIFIGYSIGIAPVISYNYGAGNKVELKNILKKSLVIIAFCSVCMAICSELLAKPLSLLYVSYNPDLYALTVNGFRIYSFSFLFSGVAIFGSAFFTALNNGILSAVMSMLRTLVFQVIAVLTLPLLFDVTGIWLSMVVAEVCAFIISIIVILAKRKRYGY